MGPHRINLDALQLRRVDVDDPEFKKLVEHIKNGGEIDPVIIHRGKLVDGLHRVMAARIAGVSSIPTKFI